MLCRTQGGLPSTLYGAGRFVRKDAPTSSASTRCTRGDQDTASKARITSMRSIASPSEKQVRQAAVQSQYRTDPLTVSPQQRQCTARNKGWGHRAQASGLRSYPAALRPSGQRLSIESHDYSPRMTAQTHLSLESRCLLQAHVSVGRGWQPEPPPCCVKMLGSKPRASEYAITPQPPHP